jgi:tRNA threonylcarbamoyladenosine biosynthesis protein TsaE
MDSMTPTQMQWTTGSAAETQLLAEKIGLSANAGMVVALVGELGSGKTAFVQGLARGLQVPDNYRITSPTFTIINEYPGRCRLIHVDLYRIETGGDLQELGLIELLHSDGVTAVEWAERLQQDLPDEHLFIELKIIDDETRQILIRASGSESKRLLQKLET